MYKESIETYKYFTLNNTDLFSTLYRTKEQAKEETIVYIHGGGLMYGSRFDLPTPYIDLILDAGYNLLCIDYPLCPESKISDILISLKESINWFTNNAINKLSLPSTKYILFGRSAGAYLCFLITKQKELKPPEAIISFYGYYSLSHSSFKSPSMHYRKYPMVSKNLRDSLIYDQPISNKSIQERFALYLYCRQQGKWLEEILGLNDNEQEFNLDKEDLENLPPIFIAASRNDQDVPYKFSVNLESYVYLSTLYSVDGDIHDFDRDTNNPIGYTVYKEWIEWLNRILL